MAKTGPTPNNASAFAQLKDVPPPTITQLGYDLRKPDATDDPRGSHCGAGAPRFNVVMSSGTIFIGCDSAFVQSVGTGWIRLRWGFHGITDVKSIALVLDEGQDTGPDNFGAAVLGADVLGRPAWSSQDLSRIAFNGNRRKPRTASLCDGASRARTGDLLGAIQALSQLSYSPEGETV
jgi:hypothetical protein